MELEFREPATDELYRAADVGQRIGPRDSVTLVAQLHGRSATERASRLGERHGRIVGASGATRAKPHRHARAAALDIAKQIVEKRLIDDRSMDGRFVSVQRSAAPRGRANVGMIATALCGAGQTYWHTPQPVQASCSTRGRPRSTAIASGTGHCSIQTLQACP